MRPFCLLCVLLHAGAFLTYPQATRRIIELPGQQNDGSVLLPNQWSLRPVGKQIALGDFPVNIAVHPKSEFAAVLHCGYGHHEILALAIPSGKIISRVSLDEAFYGIAFSPDGSRVFCSGAGDEVIHSFAFQAGYLSNHQEIPLRDPKVRGVPCGLAVSGDAKRLWVANVWGQRISEISLTATPQALDFQPILKSAVSQPPLVAPSSDPDLAAASKRQEAQLEPTGPDDPFPYACVLDEKRQRLYVSLWARARVIAYDLGSREIVAEWNTQEHPNEMLLSPSGQILFVANANRNTVSVIDLRSNQILETLSASLQKQSPPGSTPNSLALSPDGSWLFVANACNNNLAVFDVSQPGQSRSLGFIPVGWYPTSVRVTPDGKFLLVANGKGLSSKPNRHGPQPGKKDPPATVKEYIAGLFLGTLSIIELPEREKFLERLRDYTARAYQCSPMKANAEVVGKRPANNPIPGRVGGTSPIKHCIYIIKENRTYDQVLGDLAQGNGDPNLCLFPESVTPNHHALAREFVLLDNFYVESEVSADGHEWTVGAYASDFVEKSWPMGYGHNKSGKYPYPSEGRFPVAAPAEGYIWDRARVAGVTYRSYGEFVNNGKLPGDPATTTVRELQGHFDPWFRCWDMDYPDVKRAERFIEELKRFEHEGQMPRLQIVRLPNDHTFGTSVGKRTPRAMVADNDLAFGMLVEAVSRSKFWPETAIFVVEDDAQNGPDHVDAHRTIAFAISPYTKRGVVDSTMYSTSSMLRTIELILSLRPMSQFDASAIPMYHSFQSKPDLKRYRARPVTVDLGERNLETAWGRELSEKMDFSKEDAADDLLLNEMVWRSVRGADQPMPPPTRAAFVFVHPEESEEKDH
jgi:DNA-binding beta-propeller fold protein YncE